jgi:hypothetical protein
MSSITIDADYPGGNILVDGVDEAPGEVKLRPDLRDTEGWWFYWNFRVRGAAGRKLAFRFDRDIVGVRGPAVSIDEGESWRWLGKTPDDSFSYEFGGKETAVRFAFAFPYMERDLQKFLAAKEDNRAMQKETLCLSRGGREVELLRCGRLDGKAKYRFLFTARHHACESMANFVLEGLLAEAVADNKTGKWFQENAEIFAVPFMDKDGVELGDQGKNRRPHDHNRDYIDNPIHPEVMALMRLSEKRFGGRPDLAIDFHCPSRSGGTNETVFFVGGRFEEQSRRLLIFSEILADYARGLNYSAANNMAFGTGWNKSDTSTCSRWFARLQVTHFSNSLEVPYANAEGTEVNSVTAREFGRSMATALMLYCEGV